MQARPTLPDTHVGNGLPSSEPLLDGMRNFKRSLRRTNDSESLGQKLLEWNKHRAWSGRNFTDENRQNMQMAPEISEGHAVLIRLRAETYALTTLPDLMQPVQTRIRLLVVFTFALTV